MATEKTDMTNWFDKFLTTYKQTHVSVNWQQVQIECSRLWGKIKKGKENAATKSQAQKLTLQWKMNVKNARERFSRKVFYQSRYKER